MNFVSHAPAEFEDGQVRCFDGRRVLPAVGAACRMLFLPEGGGSNIGRMVHCFYLHPQSGANAEAFAEMLVRYYKKSVGDGQKLQHSDHHGKRLFLAVFGDLKSGLFFFA